VHAETKSTSNAKTPKPNQQSLHAVVLYVINANAAFQQKEPGLKNKILFHKGKAPKVV